MKCKNCKNLINGWCEKKIDSPVPETERKCGDYEAKTNYDRIKQMSIDEMAYTIMCPYEINQDICNENNCIKCTKAWLEQEVSENE